MAGSRRRVRGRRRWPWLVAAAGAAALGAWWTLAGPGAPAPPLDEIDAESREALERVLREAERE